MMKYLVNLFLEVTWKTDNIPNETAILRKRLGKENISIQCQPKATFNKELLERIEPRRKKWPVCKLE